MMGAQLRNVAAPALVVVDGEAAITTLDSGCGRTCRSSAA